MTRLFFDASPSIGDTVTLTGEDLDHLRVLRTKPGELLELCNPSDQIVYQAKAEKISKEDAQIQIIGFGLGDSEPASKITLFQAIPKLDKMELILQKCVELGVFKIVPMFTARTVTHPANAGIKAKRWQKIAKSAAQQSRRDIIPEVGAIITFQEALASMTNFDHSFVANEQEDNIKATEAFKAANKQNIAIFVGPEGGFDSKEIDELVALGAKSVSLGKRTLRVETASIATIVIFMSAKEEL